MAEYEIRKRAREAEVASALETERLARVSLVESPLMQFIPRVEPTYFPPVHLAPAVDILEQVEERPVRLILNVPPQHAKTCTLLLFLVRYLLRYPNRNVAYVTYNQKQAHTKSRECRSLAARAGVQIPSDGKALGHWYTGGGGGAIFTTVRGPELTGQHVNVLVVDDPHANRIEAESRAERDNVWEFYRGLAVDRVRRGGTIVITHTRWTDDDLTGRLIREEGDRWERVNLRAEALEDEYRDGRLVRRRGEALWPERWPVDCPEFEYQRTENPYEWHSKYLGEPRRRGGTVFEGATFYDRLPAEYQVHVGVDLNMSSKTSSDWSVALALATGSDGRCYVLDVKRAQSSPDAFGAVLAQFAAQWPGARFRWYGTPHEAAIAELLRKQHGVHVMVERPIDKLVQSQPAAGAWNAGRILVPRTAGATIADYVGPELDRPAWVAEMVKELGEFTGVKGKDAHDDHVDALAAAYDLAMGSRGLAIPRVFQSMFGRMPTGGYATGVKRNRPPDDESEKVKKLFEW